MSDRSVLRASSDKEHKKIDRKPAWQEELHLPLAQTSF